LCDFPPWIISRYTSVPTSTSCQNRSDDTMKEHDEDVVRETAPMYGEETIA
jgi:hypothetical protein